MSTFLCGHPVVVVRGWGVDVDGRRGGGAVMGRMPVWCVWWLAALSLVQPSGAVTGLGYPRRCVTDRWCGGGGAGTGAHAGMAAGGRVVGLSGSAPRSLRRAAAVFLGPFDGVIPLVCPCCPVALPHVGPLTQGTLELWVDIMSAQDAARFPMWDVALPPPEEFELRVSVPGRAARLFAL